MKTFLIFLTAFALLLGVASFASGRMPDLTLAIASGAASVLTAWTFTQYDRKFLPLTRGRLVRPSLPGPVGRVTHERPHRAAA